MIPKFLEIGPFIFHAYGLIIALAILIGWYIVKKRAPFYKISETVFDDFAVFIPIVASIVGARMYHVADYWSLYSTNPISIIQIYGGGLGILGAIIGGTLGVLIFSKIKKLNVLIVLDLVAPSMALGQAVGRIGNFINQEGFGPPTTLPWGIYISPENRPSQYLLAGHFHPTFFYEALLNLIIFLLLIKLSKNYRKPGQIFGLYLIFYSTVRLFVEILRIDTWTVDGVKIAQLFSVLGIIAGLYFFHFISARK